MKQEDIEQEANVYANEICGILVKFPMKVT